MYVHPGWVPIYPNNSLCKCLKQTGFGSPSTPKWVILWQSSHCLLSVIPYGLHLLNWESTVFPLSSYGKHFLRCTDAFSYVYRDKPQITKTQTLAHVISKADLAAEPTNHYGLRKREACFRNSTNSPSHSPFISHLV